MADESMADKELLAGARALLEAEPHLPGDERPPPPPAPSLEGPPGPVALSPTHVVRAGDGR